MPHDDIAGLVLAGGRSSRFGGVDKAFQKLGGRPLIDHVLRPLRPLKRIAINANQPSIELAAYSLPIVADIVADGGPLGGVHTGLTWAAHLSPRPHWLITVPVDTPFLPDDFIDRMAHGEALVAVAIASTPDNFSPVAAIWSVDQLPIITAALDRGVRKMTDYLDLIAWRKVDVTAGAVDPLFNINTQERLTEAEGLLAQFVQQRGSQTKG